VRFSRYHSDQRASPRRRYRVLAARDIIASRGPLTSARYEEQRIAPRQRRNPVIPAQIYRVSPRNSQREFNRRGWQSILSELGVT